MIDVRNARYAKVFFHFFHRDATRSDDSGDQRNSRTHNYVNERCLRRKLTRAYRPQTFREQTLAQPGGRAR